MRQLILFSIFFCLQIYECTNAQEEEPTPEQIQMYIQILAGPASDDQFYALSAVIENNIVEAKDIIEQKFWQYSRYDQVTALKALLKLQSNSTLEYAHRLIDTLDINPHDYNLYGSDSAPDILSEKVQISNVLFELNDFSRPDFVFELIQRDGVQKVWDIVIAPLVKIMQNIPSLSESAKEELINLVYYSNDEFTRSNALIALEKVIGVEALPSILESFQNDSSDVNRYFIINQYFGKYSSDFNLEETLRERLYSEPSSSIRLHMAKILLYGPGGISNYNFVKNYINDEPDEMIKDLLELEIEQKIPRLFDEDSTIVVIIDSLISVTNQTFSFSWFGDSQFKNELQSILQSAKSNLQVGDSVACAVQVKDFQDSVDYVYADSLNINPRFVTREGWKFLYWNAQYILDRLPTPPVVVDLELNEITPAMSMKNQPGAFTMELTGSGFTSSSTVYFNGNARATTYVSDSTINAAILASDVSAVGNFPVWVSDGTTNSDTLMFSVVNNLPKEILPVMNCVTNNGDGTYTAYFGYDNQNSVSVFIPVYSQNKISPDPWDRGQPGVFKVGEWEKVFSVTWTSGNIIWHLNNKIAIAKTDSPPCQ
jgi:hypothetical protein